MKLHLLGLFHSACEVLFHLYGYVQKADLLQQKCTVFNLSIKGNSENKDNEIVNVTVSNIQQRTNAPNNVKIT